MQLCAVRLCYAWTTEEIQRESFPVVALPTLESFFCHLRKVSWDSEFPDLTFSGPRDCCLRFCNWSLRHGAFAHGLATTAVDQKLYALAKASGASQASLEICILRLKVPGRKLFDPESLRYGKNQNSLRGQPVARLILLRGKKCDKSNMMEDFNHRLGQRGCSQIEAWQLGSDGSDASFSSATLLWHAASTSRRKRKGMTRYGSVRLRQKCNNSYVNFCSKV